MQTTFFFQWLVFSHPQWILHEIYKGVNWSGNDGRNLVLLVFFLRATEQPRHNICYVSLYLLRKTPNFFVKFWRYFHLVLQRLLFQFSPCLQFYVTVLSTNVVWTFESCRIFSDKMSIFEESYDYFPSIFSDTSDQIKNKILWKIEKKIFIEGLRYSWFVREIWATSEGSYGLLP